MFAMATVAVSDRNLYKMKGWVPLDVFELTAVTYLDT